MSPTEYDIIVIDDEVSVTDIFQQYLIWKYTDWRFLTFSNPGLVYDAIVKGQITARVWVIDIMMPQKNGAVIAEAIRKHHGSEPILLAYTALERRTLETQPAYQSGMKHFNHIVNKSEDFTSVLSLAEVWIDAEAPESNASP